MNYQERCKDTAIYRNGFPDTIQDDPILDLWNGVAYCAMKLSSEAGEITQEVAKALRDDKYEFTEDRKEKIFAELGDVLWYSAMLCNELGFKLDAVMDYNLTKLADRQYRGMLGGSGSDR